MSDATQPHFVEDIFAMLYARFSQSMSLFHVVQLGVSAAAVFSSPEVDN